VGLILARLLTPEEVGIYSIVAGIVVVAHMLRDFGVSSYIIKEDNFNDEKICAAFFVTAALSWLAALIIFSSANYWASFFGREEVILIVRVLSINFLIIPFGSVSLSLLRKSMEFKALLIVNVSASLVNVVVAIAMAYLDYSYMSLVWSSVAGTVTTVLLGSHYRQKVKIVVPALRNIRSIISFGGQVSVTRMMDSTIGELPGILVGKFIGVDTVGLISRAKGLTRLFHIGVTQAIVPVLLPDLVNKKSSDKDEAQTRYLDAVSYMCSVGWPFFIFLVFTNKSLIIFLFGDNWAPAGEFVVWFSIIAAINITSSLAIELFIALDKAKVLFRYRLIINVVAFIIMLVTINYGINIFLMGLVAANLFSLVVSQLYLARYCSVSLVTWLIAMRFPAIMSIIIISVLLLMKYLLLFWQIGHFLTITFYGLITALSWFTILFSSKSKLKSEILITFNRATRGEPQ